MYNFEEEEAASLLFAHNGTYATFPPPRLQPPPVNGQQHYMAPVTLAPSYVHHDDSSALRLSRESVLFPTSAGAEFGGGNRGIHEYHTHQFYPFMHDPQHQRTGTGHAASSSLQFASVNASETMQQPQGFGQIQREFLNFLMSNLVFLSSVGYLIPEVVMRIRRAFEEHIQQHFLSLPSSGDLNRIFQSFRPVIGTPAIRRESDTRMNPNQSVRIVCPFPFCDNHYTRSANLRRDGILIHPLRDTWMGVTRDRIPGGKAMSYTAEVT
ncbi:hypothetical protein BDN70DRAFT_896471 [Pholiota conissans]|uniref:Uncharacterized protein n=1 Tax=Pholiota conissans TaxID=109636 RepID=A0A9P5YZP6_9AGAR|nr:hypothetical protein BDN70DRAFT_896471 [Pholiota conissans]